MTVTNVDTGVSISRMTDKSGEYLVPALSVGVYSVVATMDGFNDAVTKNVHLAVGTNQEVNLKMTIGSKQTVTVESNELTLETETSQR